MVECSVLRELELTAKKFLRLKTVSESVTRFDRAQKAAMAIHQSRVAYYSRL